MRKLNNKNLKPADIGLYILRKEAISNKMQDEGLSADVETTSRYLEDLAKLIDKGDFTE